MNQAPKTTPDQYLEARVVVVAESQSSVTFGSAVNTAFTRSGVGAISASPTWSQPLRAPLVPRAHAAPTPSPITRTETTICRALGRKSASPRIQSSTMITHVAIRFQNKIWSLPPPNRHHDIIRLIVKETGVKYVDARDDDQGFLIDGVDYYRRKPALRHAKQCGQLKPGCLGEKLGKLYSEDVW